MLFRDPAKWRKPAIRVLVVTVIVCSVLAMCVLTNPLIDRAKQEGDANGIGVRVTSKVSPKMRTLTIRWQNNSKYAINYGNPFDIEYFEDGEWVSCASRGSIFHMIGYGLYPGGFHEKEYSLLDFNLTRPGKYRFIAECNFDRDEPATQGERFSVWTSFTLDG